MNLMQNLAFLALTVPEIWRESQNSKIRSRDPFPTCKLGVTGDPIFGFLDPDLPIHYITFMELRWRLRVVYSGASPLLKHFLAGFCSKIWVTCIGGRRWPHIWIPWPQLAYSLYNFHWATMTIKGSLQASIPIVKAFLTRNFLSPVEKWPKICGFWGKMGSKCKILCSGPQKAHPCAKGCRL